MILKKEVVEAKKLKEKVVRKLENEFYRGNLTRGQRAADWLAKWVGSWWFILAFFTFLILWMLTNIYFFVQYELGEPWDPYPFIFLNLVLSCLAAIQAPVILMSQNRAVERDRQRAEYDYAVNRKAEREIQDIKKQLERIERKLK